MSLLDMEGKILINLKKWWKKLFKIKCSEKKGKNELSPRNLKGYEWSNICILVKTKTKTFFITILSPVSSTEPRLW